jgi:hypothetical protein
MVVDANLCENQQLAVLVECSSQLPYLLMWTAHTLLHKMYKIWWTKFSQRRELLCSRINALVDGLLRQLRHSWRKHLADKESSKAP